MLNGRTALVVEEEFLIALDIQRMLETLDVGQTLFARTASKAEQLRAHWPDLGLAVVEVRDHHTPAHDLVEQLRNTGVPLVLTTSDVTLGRTSRAFPDLPVILKPLPEDEMTSAIREALAPRV